ncbi:MAG: alkaline phosphatase family protein [Ferruginibacter sp.]
MKTALFVFFLFCGSILYAQQNDHPKNLFIITVDGLRWQEVFGGADERVMNNPGFVQDTALTREMYGAASAEERRRILMPFFWNVIARKGQLHGNRNLDNKVDVSNPYKVSYPGYSEMLTGYADPFVMNNSRKNNSNENLLEFLNKQSLYKNSVAVFASWNVFPFILNKERNSLPVNSGYEAVNDNAEQVAMINRVQDSVYDKEATRYDLLTFLHAKQYVKKNHPRVMLLGLGETDEFGHKAEYDNYLQQANNVDKMIAELWYLVQTDPFYKDNTIFMITTDHGRGSRPAKWYSHSGLVKGSGSTWIALMGPGIKPLGEIKANTQIYQKQFAATAASLIDQDFDANHPVATAFTIPETAYQKQEQGLWSLGISIDTFLTPEGILLMLVLVLTTLLLKMKRRYRTQYRLQFQ